MIFYRDEVVEAINSQMTQRLFQEARKHRHWIFRSEFGDGFWKGEDITKLETSHLLNCRDMLLRMENQLGRSGTIGQALFEKRVEINKILKTRTGEIIRRHEIRITTEDLIAWMKSRGVHIPKSGAGVYIGKQKIEECYLRFDTTHKIKNTTDKIGNTTHKIKRK